MGQDGFTVDYNALENLGQQLANLRAQFSQGADAISGLLNAISDSDLRSQLSSFATNWSDERAKLLENMDKAAGFATEAAGAYRTADEGDAAAFHRASGG